MRRVCKRPAAPAVTVATARRGWNATRRYRHGRRCELLDCCRAWCTAALTASRTAGHTACRTAS
eukprot:194418-Chlamydomonas_euryale.AAC.1